MPPPGSYDASIYVNESPAAARSLGLGVPDTTVIAGFTTL